MHPKKKFIAVTFICMVATLQRGESIKNLQSDWENHKARVESFKCKTPQPREIKVLDLIKDNNEFDDLLVSFNLVIVFIQ